MSSTSFCELCFPQDEPDGSLDCGHLGEIQRWTGHARDLNLLLKQFHDPALQQVLKILTGAKSAYVKPFLYVHTPESVVKQEGIGTTGYLIPFPRWEKTSLR